MEPLEHPSVGIVIGDWVIKEAIRQAKIWQHNITISVNVTSAQLLAPDFITKLAQSLNENTGFNPERLVIEVSENTVLKNTSQTAQVLDLCRTLGVNVALDNFGTGYASLVCIEQMPINRLKVGKSLIHSLSTHPKNTGLVKCLVTLSKALNIQLIAEAVETAEQQQALITAGYRMGQGYFLAQPMPADKARVWINAYH